MARTQVIDKLANMIAEIRLAHPVRVGIDGVDCAGKTKLAEELIKAHDIDPGELLVKEGEAPPGLAGTPPGAPPAMPPVGVGRTPAKPRIRPEEALPGRAMAGGQP